MIAASVKLVCNNTLESAVAAPPLSITNDAKHCPLVLISDPYSDLVSIREDVKGNLPRATQTDIMRFACNALNRVHPTGTKLVLIDAQKCITKRPYDIFCFDYRIQKVHPMKSNLFSWVGVGKILCKLFVHKNSQTHRKL